MVLAAREVTAANGAEALPLLAPASLIDAIVTERGIIPRPDADKLRAVFG